jgi:hypothetical protein
MLFKIAKFDLAILLSAQQKAEQSFFIWLNFFLIFHLSVPFGAHQGIFIPSQHPFSKKRQ